MADYPGASVKLSIQPIKIIDPSKSIYGLRKIISIEGVQNPDCL